jgi:hypothetical protein
LLSVGYPHGISKLGDFGVLGEIHFVFARVDFCCLAFNNARFELKSANRLVHEDSARAD